ncbi:MAG: DUF6502 family protein, partial [Gammaproteobacteria bacterium]|nr:DUF6502 family protein [Gammaproteobacteria bacterium]
NELIRKLSVDVVAENQEFHVRSKVYNSQIATVTGLSRKEVLRLRSIEAPLDAISTKRRNRASRVLSGWRMDQRYLGSDGEPMKLPMKSSDGVSFHQLVNEYSGDVTPRTILNELKESGSVVETEDCVELVNPGYVPVENVDDHLEVIALGISDLTANAEHNLRPDVEERYLQRVWWQNYVPEEDVEGLRVRIREEGIAFGRKIDELMAGAAHKRPLKYKSYKRMGVGVYYFQDD